MIKHWTIRNFKSIARKTTLDLAPLTVFAGANSSGKSTLIQSILLTTQTVQNSVHSKSVILNGHISRLGTFNDILSNKHEGKPEIEIGFELEPKSENILFKSRLYGHGEDSIEYIKANFTFTAKGKKGINQDILQLQPILESCNFFIKNTSGESDQIKIKRSKKTIESRIHEYQLNTQNLQNNDLQSLEYEIVKPTKISESDMYYKRRLPRNSKIVGATLNHFLPITFAILYDKIHEDIRKLSSYSRPQEISMILSQKIYF